MRWVTCPCHAFIRQSYYFGLKIALARRGEEEKSLTPVALQEYNRLRQECLLSLTKGQAGVAQR